ncbi:MAG: ArsS family sensor histidine kinase [Campylobacterota bacterium]|nr:ArsS family sensor histidine kinase [Campylobacterota bacterium]
MKNISITTFINIIFTVTLISIVSLFIVFIKLDKQIHKQNMQKNFELTANTFLTKFKYSPTQDEIGTLAKKLQLKQIKDKEKFLQILNNAKTLHTKETEILRVRVFELKKKRYLYIQSIGYNIMLKTKPLKHYNFYISISILVLLLMIIYILYLALLKKLKPLKELNQTIEMFSKGDLTVRSTINSNDEIGQISKSFNEAIANIEHLINSKNLFMKNIIHELKTPITKGIFLANMIKTDNQEDKKLLIKNLNNLNGIINQLSNIEKLKTIHLQIKKENVNIKEMMNQIMIILNKDEKQISYTINNCKIIANKELIATMIKNLIDNGFKYSSIDHVEVRFNKNNIEVISKGSPLKKELSHYTQAFVQERKNSSGYGLGLYIVNEIAKLHGFKLGYMYRDGENFFIVNQ